MASKMATPRYLVKYKKIAKRENWSICDLSLSDSGNIAVSCTALARQQSAIDVFSIQNSISRDTPVIFYSREMPFSRSGRRLASFVQPDGEILVTFYDGKIDLIDIAKDEVFNSREIDEEKEGWCMYVTEKNIYVGFRLSSTIKVYNVTDLHEIKSIVLEGRRKKNIALDIQVSEGKIFVCNGELYPDSFNQPLMYEEESGKLLWIFSPPIKTLCYANSITVSGSMGFVAIVWLLDKCYISFHLLSRNNGRPFVTVEVQRLSKIRISDEGKWVIGCDTQSDELVVYDMADLFTYNDLKKHLASQIREEDFATLTNYFAVPKSRSDAMLESDFPVEDFLLALEEKGVIGPSDVAKLVEAFSDLKINLYCRNALDIFKRTSFSQTTYYEDFLAILSAHLTLHLPYELCNYFRISDGETAKITSSPNPGLSFLLTLDKMDIINASHVGALEQPFTKLQLVQAVAKVHEYQTEIEERKKSKLYDMNLTKEEKRDIFIKLLRKKISNWYETMTPVPWKKSCRWKLSDLFVGCSLTLTESHGTRSLTDIDKKCKIQYTEIFSHAQLKSETRILIGGDPGSGKTMLSTQLAYDWSQDKVCEIDILIFLPLKMVENKTLIEAVREVYQPVNKSLSLADMEGFILESESRCCFLLDGLEEYSCKKSGKTSEIMQVMTKTKYPTCKVVVTSRSDFIQNLPPCPLLKIGEFGETERNSYIKKVFNNDPPKQMEVMKVIEETSFMQDFATIPFLFVLAVHNAEEVVTQQGHLDKAGPFVEKLVQSLCHCSSTGNAEGVTILSDDLLLGAPKGVNTQVYKRNDIESQVPTDISLGQLAFSGLCMGKQELLWDKRFIERNLKDSKKWLDAGIFVVEEAAKILPPGKYSQTEGHASETNREKETTSTMGSRQTHGDQSPILTQDTDLGFEISPTGTPGSELQSVKLNTATAALSAHDVPLRVRFLHKLIQEWFAAVHIASIFHENLSSKYSRDLFDNILYQINPADLHYVLRFTCYLCPPCCHLVISHLLNTYFAMMGKIPEFILNCICLCLIEHDGKDDVDLRNVVTEICKEDITIHAIDGRFLQKSKLALLQFAEKHEIPIRKLNLSNVLRSSTEFSLIFQSGVILEVLPTLEAIEVSRWDQTLTDKDYINLLRFIGNCNAVQEACLTFPSEPPAIDEESWISIKRTNLSVKWTIGAKVFHTLDGATGKWMPFGRNLSTGAGLMNKGDYQIQQLNWQTFNLETEAAMSRRGGKLEIPKTGVKLYVPPNAFEDDVEQCLLHMGIILPDTCDEPVTSFASNSSAVVELLPNNLRLKQTVILTVPHCLQLENDRGDGNYTVKIFISHHEKGTLPVWEEKTQLLYYLDDTKCTIWLENFCWVKFEVNGAIVKGKKIQVFAAGKALESGDSIVETELGYFPDLPAGGEILRNNENLILSQQKPFLFLKKTKLPLKFSLLKVTPLSWNPLDHFQEIPYECIANSEECSCPFIFENESQFLPIPVCIFRVSQGHRGFQLTVRNKALPTVVPNQRKKKPKESEEPLLDCFLFLKRKLFREWKDFGRYLRLSEDEISRFSCENKDDVGECIYQMLLTWQRENGSRATREKLVEVLKKLGRKDLAENMPSS